MTTTIVTIMPPYITTEQDVVGIVSYWSVGSFGNDPRLDPWSVLLSDHARCCTWTQDVALLLQQRWTDVRLGPRESRNCLIYLTTTDVTSQKCWQ